MKTRNLVVLLAIASSLMMASCQSKKTDQKNVKSVQTASVDDQKIKNDIVRIVNSMPSNTETVNLINSTGAAYLAGFTNENLKTENLLTRTDKAQAYGSVIFDLAYTNTYKQVELFSKLLKVYESLTKELGFEELVNRQKQFKNRYEQNKDNTDSINIIVADMLSETNSFIQNNGSGVDISLVVAGAVVKSLNVITYLTMFAPQPDKLIEILKQQKHVLNASCDILKKFPDDEYVSKLYQKLLPIANLFRSPEPFSSQTIEKINKMTSFISEQ